MKPKERKDRMIRTQINELENRKAIEKINKIKTVLEETHENQLTSTQTGQEKRIKGRRPKLLIAGKRKVAQLFSKDIKI